MTSNTEPEDGNTSTPGVVIPTWAEGIEALRDRLLGLVTEAKISINDARVIEYLVGRPAQTAAAPAIRCSKHFPHPDGGQAVELLLVARETGGEWSAVGRCAVHPAADDIRILRKVDPAIKCAVVSLAGADGDA